MCRGLDERPRHVSNHRGFQNLEGTCMGQGRVGRKWERR